MSKSKSLISLTAAAGITASAFGAPPDCDQLAATRVVKIGGMVPVFLEKMAISLKDGFSCHLVFPIAGTVKSITVDDGEPKASEVAHFCFDISRGAAEVTHRVTITSPTDAQETFDYNSTRDRESALEERAVCRKRFFPAVDL